MSEALVSPSYQPPSKRARLLTLAAMAIGVTEFLLHHSALIDPVPNIWRGLGFGIGGVVGGLFSLRIADMPTTASGTKHLVTLASIPVIVGLYGSYCARNLYEYVHFAGFEPTRSHLMAEVTGASPGRWSGPTAYVRANSRGRELQVRVDEEVYARLDPVRVPGRDCLRLDVEIGRRGVRRALVPTNFDADVGIDRLAACRRP